MTRHGRDCPNCSQCQQVQVTRIEQAADQLVLEDGTVIRPIAGPNQSAHYPRRRRKVKT